VAIDNAISEWSFANHFFGQLSLGTQQVPESGSTLFPNTSRLDLGPASVSGSSTPMIRKGSFVSSIADSDSYLTGSPSEMNSNSGTNEQKTQTAIDLVFKQVIEPVFEYHKVNLRFLQCFFFFSFFELPIPQTQVPTLALFPDIHKQLVNYERPTGYEQYLCDDSTE
jgi:hypothetical protein